MFTGLIEAVGTVASVEPTAVGYRFRVASTLAPDLTAGESIAVNGVCLTVIGTDGGALLADVSPDTARVTTLGRLEPGRVVNLERPLRADGRVGGHFVQGHVDATGTIDQVQHEADFHRITVGYPSSVRTYMVPRGSIAVDGVSLTIVSLQAERFEVQIVPFTWEHTNFSRVQPGDAMNLECDILGKYVARAVEATAPRPP